MSLIVEIGKVPPTTIDEPAVRWYDQPVTGGVVDPDNNGWYRRDERVIFTISGGLAGRSRLESQCLESTDPDNPCTGEKRVVPV